MTVSLPASRMGRLRCGCLAGSGRPVEEAPQRGADVGRLVDLARARRLRRRAPRTLLTATLAFVAVGLPWHVAAGRSIPLPLGQTERGWRRTTSSWPTSIDPAERRNHRPVTAW